MRRLNKRDEGGREAGTRRLTTGSRERKRGMAAGTRKTGGARRTTGSSTGQSEHGEDEKKDGEQEETGKHKDWRAGFPEEEQEQQQGQRRQEGKQQQSRCPQDPGPEKQEEV